MVQSSQDQPFDEGAAAAVDALRSVLVEGEAVVVTAMQHRLFALFHRRDLAAAVTGRFVFLTRRLFGGFDPVGVRWQDLREVQLTVGMIGATVTIAYSANLSDTAMGEGDPRTLRASGLHKASAQALYRECQAQEQAWREKRRVRSIEEMRAQAGGVQVATGLYPSGRDDRALDGPSAPPAPTEDPTRRLSRARDMLAQGLISDAEYETIKARIVGAL